MSSRPSVSSRRKTYRDYLGFLSPQRAKRVLWMLGFGLLALEGAARLYDPHYERTAGNSLHGVRAIYQQALDDPAPKILAFGDSTLVGGGVYAHEQTVIGQMERELRGPRLYNLAMPGGDTTSTTLLLGAIEKRPIPDVDRVIIEVLPSKFMVSSPGQATGKLGAQAAWEELERFIPSVDAAAYDLPLPARTLSQRVETAAQWQLGRTSHFYRHRGLSAHRRGRQLSDVLVDRQSDAALARWRASIRPRPKAPIVWRRASTTSISRPIPTRRPAIINSISRPTRRAIIWSNRWSWPKKSAPNRRLFCLNRGTTTIIV